MSTCAAGCGNRVYAKSKVKCRICAKEYHHLCADLSESEIAKITSENLLWTCKDCSIKFFVKPSSSTVTENDINLSQPTLNDVVKLIQELRLEQRESIKSIECLQEDTNEIRKTLNKITADLRDKEEKIELINGDIANLKKENEELKEKVNILEQNNCVNWLELSGIPEVGKDENVFVTAQIVSAALGFKLEEMMVDSCYRKKENVNKPAQSKTIVIKFIMNRHKQELVRCRKIKRDFSTQHLASTTMSKFIKEHETIYVNDFLTAQNRVLYYKAKEFKKTNNVKFLWTRNGSIFLRKNETSAVVNIKSLRNCNDAL